MSGSAFSRRLGRLGSPASPTSAPHVGRAVGPDRGRVGGLDESAANDLEGDLSGARRATAIEADDASEVAPGSRVGVRRVVEVDPEAPPRDARGRDEIDAASRSPGDGLAPDRPRRDAFAPDARRAGAAPRPTLDELRDRIAGVLSRASQPSRAPHRRMEADELRVALGTSTSTLPFVVEETADGPLHLARKRTPLATRFGDAPLHAAVEADPSMLALLARDPNLAHVDLKHALYLDTETTGLMGGTGTVPFLIGLAYYDEAHESFVVEQMLLRRFGEEAPMLAHLAERLARASCVVTFNGKSFDVPLVRARAVMNRRAALPVLPHLDLLHVARRVHGGWLGSCSLRSVEENVLGHARFDDVAGSDICAAYFHFARTGDEYALGGVVEHNLSDVLAMIALVGFYGETIDALGTPTAGAPRRAEDLAGVARTLARAGAHDRAESIADLAVERGGGRTAHVVRADILKARGDKARALREYEAALAVDPARADARDEGRLHLSLAKLYEHAERSFEKALEAVDRGTTEGVVATEKRRARLVRKLETSAQKQRQPKAGRAAAAGELAAPAGELAAPPGHAARRRSRGAS